MSISFTLSLLLRSALYHLPKLFTGFSLDRWDDVLSDLKAKPILDTPPPQYQASGFCRFELHPCPIGELDQVLQNPSPFRYWFGCDGEVTYIVLHPDATSLLIWREGSSLWKTGSPRLCTQWQYPPPVSASQWWSSRRWNAYWTCRSSTERASGITQAHGRSSVSFPLACGVSYCRHWLGRATILSGRHDSYSHPQWF